MKEDIRIYHEQLNTEEKAIGEALYGIIEDTLSASESKVWHAHPVWFIDGNPIVGYSKQKAGMKLMFWSGADFEEEGLNVLGKKFKDASVVYNKVADIHPEDLKRWLMKSKTIQWDYKNIVKRKGRLEKIEIA